MTGWRRPDAYIGFLNDRLLEQEAEITAELGDTMCGAFGQLGLAGRRCGGGVAFLVDLREFRFVRPFAEMLLKRWATRYETHPDYSEWWRS